MFKRGGKLYSEHIPTSEEIRIISKYQGITKLDYQLIRVSKTMKEKSTIDASGRIRDLLLANKIVDFASIGKGKENKLLLPVGVFFNKKEIFETKVSFYRPTTKNGDPRFWIYGMAKHLIDGELLFITSSKGKLVIIPVNEEIGIIDNLTKYFSSDANSHLIEKVKRICHNKFNNWIESVSPYQSNPKDVGETFEKALGIKSNSDQKADIDGEIEIKSKRELSKTKLSLFSKVPNWEISPIKSSREMILNFGYESSAHPGFMDLYVTVSNHPNNQGLFLSNDYDNELLIQHQTQFGDTCYWNHKKLKSRLFEKHPNTIWVEAQQQIIDGKINFLYSPEMIFTSHPIFSQFLSLIDTSIITFDWRGKVRPDGKKYRDHGHGFRIDKSNRNLLFDENIDFSIT